MTAFFLAFLFGILQIFLLNRLLTAVTTGNTSKIWLFLLLKFSAYGIAIALLMLRYFESFIYCFCGFAAGMPLGAVVWFVFTNFVKPSAKWKNRRRR